MSALSSSVSSLHRDIRSDARSYKRDKDHNSKWIAGYAASAGVKCDMWDGTPITGSKEQQEKVRPASKHSDRSRWKNYANVSQKSTGYAHGLALGRVSRTQEAMFEVASPATMSRSLIDLIPAPDAANNLARTPTVAHQDLFPLEVPSPPRKVAIGLDSLVERAEKDFVNRQTDKLVRDEYEILDVDGEATFVAAKPNGKKGKKSPKQLPKVALPLPMVVDDEDDWERI